ncbi:protein-export chaperone SecB [Dongia deserti]|uniref:protein-export chaperone SecB n=1 Tax=Dongia deserti TaxID=2268030 RepID=UPI000E653D42|nr:protein-export chaperone SecB [Dongia deserti]
MAENDKQGGAEAGNPQSQGFPLTVVTQYVKDLSFENPGGPDSLMTLKEVPHGTVRVDVRVQPRTPPEIEIVLFLAVEAKASDKVVYVAECEYGGIFRLGRVSQEVVLPLIMIEAPRLLFPFARQVIAHAISAGGFPPLLINPIDFAALYRDKREEMMKQAAAAQPTGEGDGKTALN